MTNKTLMSIRVKVHFWIYLLAKLFA